MSESLGANSEALTTEGTSPIPPFSTVLKSCRELLGLTQQDLADRSGVSLPAVRDMEQGRSRRPRRGSVRKLIAALDLSDEDEARFISAAYGVNARPATAPVTPDHAPMGVTTLGVLGPLTIWRDGIPVPLGSPKLKAIVLRLALSGGEAVSREELIDLLWGGGPPDSAVNLLHTYIRRLRRLLQPEPDSVRLLQTSGAGYRLVMGPDRLDLARFRELASRGAEAADGDRALAVFAEAARLWRGETDVDPLRNHPLAAAVTEEYASLLSAYAATARDLGESEQALPRLRSLAAGMELHEPLHAELIATLSASGRQAEALAAYERIRADLVEQLGIEPGAQLREAHRRALEGWHRSETKVARRAAPIQQTPSPPPDFVGRDLEVHRILRELDGSADQTGPAAKTVAVVGAAGVGKTALALQVAWRLREAYPDGQLYADLCGVAEAPTDPLEVIGRFLRALGVRDRRFGADVSEDAALLRSELADRRMLILLDNVRDVGQVMPLLPGTGRCAVLVTSRWRLPELVGASAVELLALPAADALALLRAAIGEQRMSAEPRSARQLVSDCGRLPLALRVAGARLAGRPAWSVGDLSKRLQDEGRRLSELRAGETSVPASFGLSYRDLTEPAKRAFRLCSQLPGDEFGIDSVAALLGIDGAEADAILGELLDSSMLMQYQADRFRYHDLLGLYASRLAGEDDPEPLEADRDRYHSWCLRAVTAAMGWVYPQMVRWRTCDDPEAVFATREAALDWLEAEVPALVTLIERLADTDRRRYAWQIADQLRGYFLLHRQFDRWLRSTEAGARAAEGDPSAAAAMLMSRGQAMWGLGRHDEALEAYTAGARLADDGSWKQAAAYLRHNIGLVLNELGRLEEAERSFLLALELSDDELGHVRAVAFNGLGTMCNDRGRLREAVHYFTAALEINRRTGRERSYLANQSNLGMVLRQLGEFDAAEEHLEAALEGGRNAGDGHAEMAVLDELSMLCAQRGRGAEAVSLGRQGYDLARILKDRRAEAALLNTLGEALLVVGDVRAAKEAFGRSLETDDFPYFAARAMSGLASALRDDGDDAGAIRHAARAVEEARRHGFEVLEADALTVQARCLVAGDPASAATTAVRAAEIYRASGMDYLAERVRAEFCGRGAAEDPSAG